MIALRSAQIVLSKEGNTDGVVSGNDGCIAVIRNVILRVALSVYRNLCTFTIPVNEYFNFVVGRKIVVRKRNIIAQVRDIGSDLSGSIINHLNRSNSTGTISWVHMRISALINLRTSDHPNTNSEVSRFGWAPIEGLRS